MDYLDFEIEIDNGNASEYRIIAGEACETTHLLFDENTLENQFLIPYYTLLSSRQKDPQILSSAQQKVQNFGRTLFDTLFVGGIRSLYTRSQREAFGQNKGLRLKLRIQSPKLAALPWEFLYDANRA